MAVGACHDQVSWHQRLPTQVHAQRVVRPAKVARPPKRARLEQPSDSCVGGRLVLTCARAAAKGTATVSPEAIKPYPKQAEKFVYWTADRIRVLASVEKQKSGYVVTISVPPNHHHNGDYAIVWGTLRSSTAKWFNPEEIVPPGSQPATTGKGLRSVLAKVKSGHEILFKLSDKLAPVFVAFKLELAGQGDKRRMVGPSGGLQHFAVPVGLGRGDPLKYGASIASLAADGISCSINFAVVSRHATAMSLCMVRVAANGSSGGYLEIALDPLVNRTGDVWHARVEGLKDIGSLCYGWRADADISWDAGNRFHPGQVMLDPYAAVAAKVQLPDGINVPPPRKGLAPTDGQSNPPALLGCLSALLESFDWEGTRRPRTMLEDSLVLELDVPSFTSSPNANGSVPPEHRGKYLGVADRLGVIKATGATAVMLTPVALSGTGLGPFGRAPFSFFAPEISFASGDDAGAAAREIKELVKRLHAEGIEVYLQVEYSLTGEGWDEDASAISLRGLDAAVYYRSKGVLNCGHANVRALILDSLRHWVRHYQVDGFCFVNAETLAIDQNGNVLDNPPLAEDIANDSELRQLKLIAWAADDSLLPRQGQRGFPHWATWLERNKRFTADFVAFFTGSGPPAIASSIATRICGSPDLFGPRWDTELPGGLATGRGPAFGLNCASDIDKAPLAATVADILPSHAPFGQDYILKKSLLFASLFCQGTPMVGADVLEDPSLADYVGRLMQLRKLLAHSLSPNSYNPTRALRWHGAMPGSQPDWLGDMAQSGVPGAAYQAYAVHEKDGSGIYVAYNPYEGPVPAILPDPPLGSQWKRAVDTSDSMHSVLLQKDWITLSTADYTVSGKTALLLVAVTLARTPQRTAKTIHPNS